MPVVRVPRTLNVTIFSLTLGKLLVGAGAQKGIPLAAIAVLVSLPGFVVKQIINCFQLKSSMQALVAYDQERESSKTD